MCQQEYFGIGSTKKLKNILSQQKIKNIFLVRGEKSYQISGAKKIIEPILKKHNVFEFYNFESNPKIDDIINGIDKFKKFNPDLVIAVGGGSVIDMAKSINLLATQTDNPKKYITGQKKVNKCNKKLIVIPTTAGSGSEATNFAVVYINKKKYSLENICLLPDYVIIDPQLTFNLPKKITASTGIDALCQAIESYWSINSNKKSKRYSKEAIELIINNLSLAVNKLDKKARTVMSKASNLAGKAICITKTTACHAISYPITSYFNILHGHACSLTLSIMLVHNNNIKKNDTLDKRGTNYVKKTISDLTKILGVSNVYEAKEIIDNLIKNVGLENSLKNLNINKNDINKIISNINLERMKNNPRKLNKKQLRDIFNNLR